MVTAQKLWLAAATLMASSLVLPLFLLGSSWLLKNKLKKLTLVN